MLGHPTRRGYNSGRQICSVIAALLDAATHVVLIVLVAAIWVARDNDNGGNEARIY